MTLLEVQRRMARAIMRPLTAADRIAPNVDARYIKPNYRLNSCERLEIYSRSYWFRVLDSLYDDFPGLRTILGRAAFHRLSKAYLADCPSQSFTLRNLGSRLEAWLREHPEFAGERYAIAINMVRLEWAHIEAFDSAAEKVLEPEDLLELGPGFRARLQPHVRLLDLQYPVDELRIRVGRTTEERGAASNAAPQREHRDLTGRLRRSKPQRIFLAVHRRNNTVYYRRLDAEEYCLLCALRNGAPVAKAIQYAFEDSVVSTGNQQSKLEGWFAAWARMGWLCPPKKGRVTQ